MTDKTTTMPDLSQCPKCGGEADNGHDRSFPPNPYNCTKCEMPEFVYVQRCRNPDDGDWMLDAYFEPYKGLVKYTRADLVPDVADLVAALEPFARFHCDPLGDCREGENISMCANCTAQQALARHARTQEGE
jgi:hypothetical protein